MRSANKHKMFIDENVKTVYEYKMDKKNGNDDMKRISE